MKRKTFDKLASTIGLLLAIGLLVAGALLTWGYSFANSQVKSQLASQHITFPATPADPKASANVVKFFKDNGGQMMTNGKQAEMYADNYIAIHLIGIGGGKTYSELSAAAMKDPTNAALQGQVATVFKGETLRSILLTAYAFWQLGQIAMISSYVAYLGGVLFLILALLGFAHLRRAETDSEI